MDITVDSQLIVEYRHLDDHASDFAQDVLKGLNSTPKRIPSFYFYDQRGSELFEQICELPEYYITRTERDILENHAADIVAYTKSGTALVEFGSGSSFKTRLLIEAFLEAQGQLHYWPVDISASMLLQTAENLLADYPDLSITPQVAEYKNGIRNIGKKDIGPKMVIFLGSNIGNFEPPRAIAFLQMVRAILNDQDCFLLGIDMEKEKRVLEAAYNDADGVTAAFNMNLLQRINLELGGEFLIENFSHFAFYNKSEGRIEMHLRSKAAQDVLIKALHKKFHFAEGETIHTENSYKYTMDKLKKICALAGFKLTKQWQDAKSYFSLNLLSPD